MSSFQFWYFMMICSFSSMLCIHNMGYLSNHQIAYTEHETSSLKSLQLFQISRLDTWFKRYCMLCIHRHMKTIYHHETYVVMKIVIQTMSCRDITKHATWNRIHGASNRLCVVSINVSIVEVVLSVREISHIMYT